MVELESIQRFISFCSFIAVFIAPFLTIGSLSKSVKWNLYNSGTDYGYPQFYPIKFKLYAYQNLWSFYDAWHGPHDHIHSQSYKEIINDPWRPIVRKSVSASVGLGAFALTAYIAFGVLRFIQLKGYLSKNAVMKRIGYLYLIFLVASSVLSFVTGITLASAMTYYKNHYQSLLAPEFYDPLSFYPNEDNLSTGYKLAAAACALFFISFAFNVAYLIIEIKKNKRISGFLKRLIPRQIVSKSGPTIQPRVTQAPINHTIERTSDHYADFALQTKQNQQSKYQMTVVELTEDSNTL